MSVWFDGRTQWAYSPTMGEVNISEPSLAELGQINPFAVVDGLQKGYKARRLKAPSGLDKLELTPADKKRAAYAKVILTLNASTSMPTHISVTASDGTRADIAISSLKKDSATATLVFHFQSQIASWSRNRRPEVARKNPRIRNQPHRQQTYNHG